MKENQKLNREEILRFGNKKKFSDKKNGRKDEEEADKNGRNMSYRLGEEAQDVYQWKERRKLGWEVFLSFGTKKMDALRKKKPMDMKAKK